MSLQTQMSLRSPDGYEIPNVWHKAHAGAPVGDVVILAHGIFSNKDERGRYQRLAELHVSHGSDVVRFDFRGHGDHPVPSDGATICGMVLDFWAVLREIRRLAEERVLVVASSFGASVLLLLLQMLSVDRPDRIVFLNPVVDYRATLVDAVLPWGRSMFGARARQEALETGFATLEEGFRMQAQMLTELELLKPYEAFPALTIPTRVIHGDADTKVPYGVTREHASKCPVLDFRTIPGGDHGFKPDAHEHQAFGLTMDWLYGGATCGFNR